MNSSLNPSILGQDGHVHGGCRQPGTGTPTGTVTFTIDGQAQTPVGLSVVNGVDQAAFSTSTLASAQHTISRGLQR